MATPLTVFNRMRDEFFRYYGTPYRLRLAEVEAERKAMLDQESATWREPWVEPVAEYDVTALGFERALSEIGAPADLAAFARSGLIDYPDIFTHQRDALQHVLGQRNVAVTAGTGSGKTEAFLLPIISLLVAESLAWTGSSPVGPKWWEIGNRFVPQRRAETGRSSAVRALVLYPMNALVEDQLGRLRRALDSPAARAWLDKNRGGHRFYFGRYTGNTPVSGELANGNARSRLQVRAPDVSVHLFRSNPYSRSGVFVHRG
jgi:ATP-dependent helicase YprA (DUF1998 family)